MLILIYGDQAGMVTHGLKEAIQREVSVERVEEYHSLDGLSKGLRRPLMGRAIAVLAARDLADQIGLLSIGDLLGEIPLILVFPDRDRNTVSAGHALRPRFVTFADSDFSDVGAVLGKMIEHMESGIESWQQRERKEEGL
jgi:hypothetical protein